MSVVPGVGARGPRGAARSSTARGWARVSAAALLAALAAPAGAAAQFFPSLPFEHKQFNLDVLGSDHMRLTGTVELIGDGYSFHADQVDIYVQASSGDPVDEESSAGAAETADAGESAEGESAGEEAETPSLRLVASGDVVFSTDEVHLSADSVEYWTIDQTAVFREAYGWIDLGAEVDRSMFGTQEPDLLFHGQMIERTGPRTYRITKGAFTSCVQPTPRWQLVATSFTLNLDSYALLANAVLKVKGVPVFYLPGMYYPIQEDGRATGFLMPTYGASLYHGSSLSNAFYWAINRSQDATFYHDWFTQYGGDGRGAEYRYTRGAGAEGDFRVYRLHEPEADIAYAGGTRTRQPRLSYEYRGQARQGLPGDWSARGQVDYFTDIDVRQTYHTNVFDASNSRRSLSGNLSGPLGDYELSGTFDYGETFFGTDAALNGAGPRLTFGRGKTELFGAPLYFAFDAEYARLLRRSRQVQGGEAEVIDSGLDRFDLYPVLQFPFNRWPFLKIDTTAAWRATFWGESLVDGQQVDTGVQRQFYEVSTRVTGPSFIKIWDTPNSGYSERMKHIYEPWVSISRVSPIDVFERIVPIEGIDSIVGDVIQYQYGLDTRLFARVFEGGPESVAREILSASLTQSYYTNATASQYDRSFRTSFSGTPPSNYSPVSFVVRAEPTQTLGGTFRVELDPDHGGQKWQTYLPFFRMKSMRTISAEGSYQVGGWLATSGGWSQRRFIAGLPGFDDPGRLDNYVNSSTSLRTRDNRFGGLYDFNFDIRHGRFLAQMLRFYYNAQCCGLRIDYQTFNFAGLGARALIAQDRRFTLSFTLAGLGTFTNNFGGAGGGYR